MNFFVFPYSFKVELEFNLVGDGQVRQENNLLKSFRTFLKDRIFQFFNEDTLRQNF